MCDALTFSEVTSANLRRCRKWHPGFPHDEAWSLADWSNAMVGEAGETANVVKKLRRIETGYRDVNGHDRDALLADLADELADVYLYLDLLATRAGITLPAAIVAKFNKVSERQGFPDRLGESAPKSPRERFGESAPLDGVLSGSDDD